ncbi:hypothetical protein GIY62_00900 [Burkholderia plantarii]|uniref:hypothetical protein n=1 Tax=Burkholderia plantarii TaxID=41899 RepID=UPI00272C5388|nr:hypothetical protein [Burkholderia plantarii]WLE59297.1 hypothetical protein GIY62_00900 [Burkholderia plantarii]
MLESAFILTAWPLAVVVVVPLAGKLAGRINGTLSSSAGVVVMATGLALSACMPSPASIGTILLWRLCRCGTVYGLFLPPDNSEARQRPEGALVVCVGRAVDREDHGAVAGRRAGGGAGVPGTAFTRLAFGLAAVTLMSSLVSVARIHR